MLSEHKEEALNDESKDKPWAKDHGKFGNDGNDTIVKKPLLARTQSLGAEPLSSVYSRSQSGEDPEPNLETAPKTTGRRQQQPSVWQQQTPGINPRVTSIVKQTPLHPTQPPSRPAPGPWPGGARAHASRTSYQPRNSSSALKNHFPGPRHQGQMKTMGEEVRSGRLPITRAVSGFGDVRNWSGGGSGESGGETVGGNGGAWAARCGLPPLPVEKVPCASNDIDGIMDDDESTVKLHQTC